MRDEFDVSTSYMLQHVLPCCSVLLCFSVCFSVLQYVWPICCVCLLHAAIFVAPNARLFGHMRRNVNLQGSFSD